MDAVNICYVTEAAKPQKISSSTVRNATVSASFQ